MSKPKCQSVAWWWFLAAMFALMMGYVVADNRIKKTIPVEPSPVVEPEKPTEEAKPEPPKQTDLPKTTAAPILVPAVPKPPDKK